MFNLMLFSYINYYLLGIVLVPGILLALYVQIKLTSTYNRCNTIQAQSGKTGKEVARLLLDTAGLQDIDIRTQGGDLSDYYDHRHKVVSLSPNSAENSTVGAIGVATHEIGHALQYKANYFPIKLRTFAIVFSNISSQLLWPLVLLGFIFGFGASSITLGDYFMWAGIIVFGLAVIVNLVTLPVEFDASKRALKILSTSGILTQEETAEARKMLNAAALTYVAALVVSILNLLRFVLATKSDRRRR